MSPPGMHHLLDMAPNKIRGTIFTNSAMDTTWFVTKMAEIKIIPSLLAVSSIFIHHFEDDRNTFP